MAAYTTINDPGAYFNTVLYTGTGSSLAITGVGFQPDLVWTKSRSNTYNNQLYDATRGVEERLQSNDTSAETTQANGLTAFDSDGFTVGDASGTGVSSATYASWNWKETADAGFDIVAYTGTGSAHTVSHNLSAVPQMIIIKNRSTVKTWQVGHESMGWENGIYLNESSASQSDNGAFDSTTPTTSVFTIETSSYVNTSGDDYITYLWSGKQGFSKFGSYIGNGNADGPFTFLGFRPAFVLLKNTERAEAWWLFDNKRDPHNLTSHALQPNSTTAELNYTAADEFNIDMLSNGFKVTASDGAFNYSGEKIIYAAFAEAPFVNSEGVPCNAR